MRKRRRLRSLLTGYILHGFDHFNWDNMRCTNCGWDNSNNLMRCEKCNAPLNGSIVEGPVGDMPTERNRSFQKNSQETLKGTIKGATPTTPYWDDSSRVDQPSAEKSGGGDNALTQCPNCSATVIPGHLNCPHCQFTLKQDINDVKKNSEDLTQATQVSQTKKSFSGTIRPNWGKSKYSFSLIPMKDGEEQAEQIDFSEEIVILNRENLDPGNKTITSKEQAIIEVIDGKLKIKNKSVLKTTYVRLEGEEAIDLKDGNVLLIGNKEFKVKLDQ